MNAWLTLPVRYLLGRKQRTVLTTLAVVFGVMVIFAVNISLPTLAAALQGGVLGLAGRGRPDRQQRPRRDLCPRDRQCDPRRVRRHRGVPLPAPPGEPRGRAQALSVKVIGMDPATAEAVRRYPVAAGRFLTASDAGRRALPVAGPGAWRQCRRQRAGSHAAGAGHGCPWSA